MKEVNHRLHRLTELSSASLRNGNDGMVEYWNIGFWKIGSLEVWKFLKTISIIPYKHDKILLLRFTIPLFHYSIIPVWNMQNGWLGIPYYQQFVEFPGHQIKKICVNSCNSWANKLKGEKR